MNHIHKKIGIILLLVLVVYIIYHIWNEHVTEQFQDLPAKINAQYQPFIFAGYHEIYDYIVSSALIKHVNMQTRLSSNTKENEMTDVIAFASIPRIYIYISQNIPDKVHLVFTKLKKSDNLVRLYNKQITGRELPDADINKTVDMDIESGSGERNSITDEQYDMVTNLVKKYSFNSVSLDFDYYLPDIKLYIQYMLSTNPGFMYNIILSDAELEKLGTTRENVTPPNAGLSLPLNPGIAQLITGSESATDTVGGLLFTTLLNNKELVPVVDNDTGMREALMKESTQSIERSIQEYLFKNKQMATNISMTRVALFKMSIVNPYQTNIFYILQDNLASGAQDELSNKELESKFGKLFTPDLSPKKLSKYSAMYKAKSKEQKMETNIIKPDLECFVLVNKFQLLRVVLKKRESELNL